MYTDVSGIKCVQSEQLPSLFRTENTLISKSAAAKKKAEDRWIDVKSGSQPYKT